MAARVPVTLVTHIRNRETMEAAGAPVAGSEVVYIDTEWLAGPLYRAAKQLFPKSEHSVFLISSLDFYVYDYQMLRTLRHRKRCKWNVAHAVTPVSPLASTRLGQLDVPVVVGPWNGGLQTPKSFHDLMSDDSAWLYRSRELGRWADRLTGCDRKAAVILSASQASDRSLPPACLPRVKRMCENAVDLDKFYPGKQIQPSGPDNPLRVLYAGRLIPAKGVPLLLRAIDEMRGDTPLVLTIAGDGPLKNELLGEVRRRGLDTVVEFTGGLALEEVAALMRNSHLFCLPSVRESGGAVLLEAKASALPVVAVNHGGPAEIVDDSVGALLSAEGPKALISDLCDVLRGCAARPQEWRNRGLAGRRRAEQQYGWEAKISQMQDIYKEISLPGAEASMIAEGETCALPQ